MKNKASFWVRLSRSREVFLGNKGSLHIRALLVQAKSGSCTVAYIVIYIPEPGTDHMKRVQKLILRLKVE